MADDEQSCARQQLCVYLVADYLINLEHLAPRTAGMRTAYVPFYATTYAGLLGTFRTGHQRIGYIPALLQGSLIKQKCKQPVTEGAVMLGTLDTYVYPTTGLPS